ncbi:hypothetical protein Ate02nite_79590 [Paractinoplanes tereljensis]|uniref:Uncharacterized protein n=2 Tax=Paractinoplanes tereljensis TaxID=571912 RepID=A0A919NWJ8_9ACTN|nr:hypothetical protein Ate02nite_79590 [Actinoplanes tereljensis]
MRNRTLQFPALAGPVRVGAVLALFIGLLWVIAPSAEASTVGDNTVRPISPARYDRLKPSKKREPAGFGINWIGISYKANGPHVGYLFPGDHFDVEVFRPNTGKNAAVDRWPYGYAGGGFGGCAFAYGTRHLAAKKTTRAKGRCPKLPIKTSSGGKRFTSNKYAEDRDLFCTDHARDPLCTPAGTWFKDRKDSKACESSPKSASCRASQIRRGDREVHATVSTKCTAFANIGAEAIYRAGRARPTPATGVGTVGAGTKVNVRYVTKSRIDAYVLVNPPDKVVITLGRPVIRWVFVKRDCLNPAPTTRTAPTTAAVPTQTAEAKPASPCHWKVVWPSAGVYELPTRGKPPLKTKHSGDVVGPYCNTQHNATENEAYVMVSTKAATDGIGWMRRAALTPAESHR